MTEEELLRLHSEDFNQALVRQDYGALQRIYSERYMLVRPDGSVLNKQQVLKDLREQGVEIPFNRHQGCGGADFWFVGHPDGRKHHRVLAQRQGILCAFSLCRRICAGK